MAGQNPIKYSDLIQPDDSIEKLVNGLTEANAIYVKLAENVRKEAQGMTSSLHAISGATEQGRQRIKETSQETDRLAKEYKKLEQAMDENAKEIARLNIARRQMTNYQKLTVQRGKEEIVTLEQIKNASYQQLSAQYSLNKAYINQLSAKERNIKKNRELIESTRQMYEQMKRLQEATGKHQLNVGNYAGALKGVAGAGFIAATGIGSLAAGATMAAGELKTGVGTAQDFEAAISKLSAILGMNKDEMAQLVEQARQLGATTVFTAQEVAELQTELAKLGYTQQDIINMTKDVLLFAQATGASLADASSLTGAALRMFEKDTEQTAEFVDKMAASTNKSALSFSFLQNALSTVSPVANAFGFKIEEVLALLGQLANAGFDASSAATATRNILLNLADSNGDLAKSLGQPVKSLDDLVDGLTTLNAQGIDLATSLDLTDKRSVAAFQTFLKGTDTVLELRDALNAADGTAAKMAKTMGDNLKGDVASMGSAWEDFMIELNNGQSIMRTIVQWITSVIRSMSDLWKKTRGQFSEMYDDSMAFRYLVESLGLTFNNTIEIVSLALKNLWSQLKGVGHFIKGIFTLDVDEIKKGWSDGVVAVFENTVTAAKNMRDNIHKAVSATINGQKKIAQEQKKIDEKVQKSGGGIASVVGSGGGMPSKETAAQKKAREKAEKEAQADAKRKLAIQRAYDDALIELIDNDNDRERARLVTKYNREIEDLKIRLETEKDLTVEERKNLNNTIIALETQREVKLADLLEKQVQKEVEDQKKIAEKKKQEAEKVYNKQVDVIDKETDLQQLQIDNIEGSEQRKTELRLKAEKDRLKKIYDLNVKAGKDLNSLEMQILREQMKSIDTEISKNGKQKDIFDLLGFDLSDEKKEAISQSFSFALDQMNDYVNAWIQAAERKVQAAEKEVDAAQAALDAEREARANGYASNVAYAQKELDLAKKNQQKALAEQEKAQKAQQMMATVQQATNLISASALIWSQLGFPWAIPAIAVMWGSFAAAKIKAAQVTSQGTEQYGEGTVELLQGGSHQSGNDVDLGHKPDGTRRRAEGGEYFAVINKRNSRRYRQIIPDVIGALNRGNFEEKYMKAFDGGQQMQVTVNEKDRDLRRLGDDVRAIREQGDRRTYTDERGTHIIHKNLHRIIVN